MRSKELNFPVRKENRSWKNLFKRKVKVRVITGMVPNPFFYEKCIPCMWGFNLSCPVGTKRPFGCLKCPAKKRK